MWLRHEPNKNHADYRSLAAPKLHGSWRVHACVVARGNTGIWLCKAFPFPTFPHRQLCPFLPPQVRRHTVTSHHYSSRHLCNAITGESLRQDLCAACTFLVCALKLHMPLVQTLNNRKPPEYHTLIRWFHHHMWMILHASEIQTACWIVTPSPGRLVLKTAIC